MNVTIHNQLSQHPAQAAAHLTPEVWAQANRLLLRKAIAEYAHERTRHAAPVYRSCLQFLNLVTCALR